MVKDAFSILIAIVVLAGLSMAIVNGGNTAKVVDAGTKGFANLISAATHPGG